MGRTELLSGRYEILGQLPAGGQSRVRLAVDHLHGEQVVLKQVAPSRLDLLRDEFCLLSRLRHPNLVEVKGLIHAGTETLLAQSFAPGPDLVTYSRDHASRDRILLAVAATCRALQFIHHRGVVHRDLKPAHIRVGDGLIGSLPAVRLIDFGLATRGELVQGAAEPGAVGTLGYIAPEVLEGDAATPAADLYSLGVVLFESLHGFLPPSVELAADLRSLIDRAGPGVGQVGDAAGEADDAIVRDLLSGLLDPRPEHRPSIRAVTDTLGRLLGRDVSLTPEELAGPYLPPAPLLGRAEALAVVDRAIGDAEASHQLLHLRGCGKSAILREACLRGQLAGFEVAVTSSPRSLFRQLAVEQRAAAIATRAASQLVDTIVGRSQPLVVALDHCGDEMPLVLELARQLAKAAGRQSGCLLLVASEEPADLPGTTTIELGPLQQPQTEELVQALLYAVDLPIWSKQVHEATGGDPRLIVELVRAQLEAGGAETLQSTEIDRGQLVADRFNSLGGEERSLLGVICQSPVALPFSQLAAVVDFDAEQDLLAALASLVRRGFVVQNAMGIGPASLTVKHSGESLIPRGRRQQTHRRFVAQLQADHERDPAALAYHLLKAGSVDEGTAALLEAASPTPEALELAARLLPKKDPRWPELVRRLARLARSRGDNARALRQADRLVRVDAHLGKLLRAEILLESGQPAKAMRALGSGRQETASGHLLVARAAFFQGDYERVAQATEAGRSMAEFSPTTGAQLDNLSGLALVCEGREEQGLVFLQRAAQTVRQVDSDDGRETLLRVLNSKGMAFQRLGRAAEAARCYGECLEVARQLGDLALAAACTLNLGTLAQDRLQLDAALQHYRRATRLCRRAGSAAMEAAAASNEANLLLLFGALDEAAARLTVAEETARVAGAETELGFVHLYQAELLLMQDQPAAALEQVELAGRYFESTDSAGRQAASLLTIEIDLRSENTAPAALDTLLSTQISSSPEGWKENLLAAKALLAAEACDWDRARQQLELAAARASAAGVGPLAWEASALLVDCAGNASAEPEGDFYRRRFTEQIETLRGAIPLPYRSRFDQRRDVSEARQRVEAAEPSREHGTEPSADSYRRLLAINRELGAQLPLERLLERILEGALELTGAERGFVLLYGEEGDEGTALSVVASRNIDGEAVRSGRDKFSRRVIEKVVASDRTLIASDALDDPRFRDRLSVTGLRLRSVLCAPLRVEGHPRGALYIDNRFRVGAFGPAHAQQIEAFADQAAIAIERARLLEETRQQRGELASAKAEVEQLNRELSARVVEQDEELTRVNARLRSHEEELVQRYNAAHIIGRSKAMQEVFFQIDRLADADVAVFIFGESGTGKELVARAIHQRGVRQGEPFVSINCGAVPANLLESELFGHERGAFTGATRDRHGLLEAAGRGTLFLDEIGDMPAEMQVKLLRVLQEGTFRRVGKDREQQSFCRVLSASHQQLEELVTSGRFREDLYYRLQVVRIELPPLRERREDIPLLVEHLLKKGGRATTVSPEALAALVSHDWPGNIRQLENELQRASLLCESEIRPADLTVPLPSRRQRLHMTSLQEELRRYERQLVEQALEQTDGNVSAAAKVLGMHRVALHRKLRALGITRR